MSFPNPSQASTERADRLLRAAVSGYCSLTRPGRSDAEQLQDLAMPLVADASRDALRFSAAALSLCEVEPDGLMLKLANMTIDIAAPVLGRSSALSDIDLINIIGRHGVSHARVIGCRDHLHPSIRQLTEIVEAREWRPANANEADDFVPEAEGQDNSLAGSLDGVEETRERLRSIMRATADEASGTSVDIDFIYEDMRESALTGSTDQVAAALANALGVVIPIARTIIRDASCSMLTPALRAIGLAEEEAFLIASAIFPQRFPNADAIRSFLKTYRQMSFEAIEVQLTRWQETSEAATAKLKRA